MPSPRFQHGFGHDVFISYTHEDDREEAGVRWVARFEAELKSRLAKVTGHSISTWRDDKLTGADRFGPEIDRQLADSAVLLLIVTPSYLRSEWCSRERATFVQRARANRGLDVNNKARLVKIAKTRVPLDRYPADLRELLEFRFYVEEPNGTAREFHLSPDEFVQRRFYTVVDDAAQAIAEILTGLEPGGLPAAKGSIYVGETSRDIESDRDQLRRSLVQRGYAVLPQASLRMLTGPEVEQIAQADLSQCQLAVFPIGAYYGTVPERSNNRSITELQLDEASNWQTRGTLPRMIWVPPAVAAAEERQQRLLTHVRLELPAKGFEIIESPLTEIETHITDRLERPALVIEEAGDASEDGAEIYLLCLPRDRDAARAVRDCLFDEGFEVRLPPTTDEGAGPLHARRLEVADAFLVYWGSADEGWVEPILTELRKAKGFRKGKPILSKALFVADPPTVEKRDFLTRHATLLQGFSSTPVKQALEPMLAEIRQASSNGRR
jgi:hypothetical protein